MIKYVILLLSVMWFSFALLMGFGIMNVDVWFAVFMATILGLENTVDYLVCKKTGVIK